MAGTYDSEQQRMIDRIKCIVFHEARDAGATFINRQWIADKIHRTTRFVSEWWEKSYDQCFADYSNAGPKLKLSQAAQDIIREASDWTEEDFLNLAPSDEFYVWTVRRPNYQNDRVWAKSIEDIEDDERYREIVKNQACIGIFIILTAKKLHWVIKDKGESWTGQYFRDTILMQHVFPFLKDEENVIDPYNVIFVHDKAPCM
ncbi:unnamed protein product [Rotaria sp. Silwood2]|nr:unnamed protein product [Rotaria sp. Silwood2]